MITKNYMVSKPLVLVDSGMAPSITLGQVKTAKGDLIPTTTQYALYSYIFDLNSKTTHLKLNKDALKYGYAYSSAPVGVCFGNGMAPESYDDYTMSGELFTTYTSSQTVSTAADDNGVTSTIVYTLTNTGAEDFTVSEVGIFGYAYTSYRDQYNNNYYKSYNVLIERTLLETPITIPANGGVGQVTYSIRYNYPTA